MMKYCSLYLQILCTLSSKYFADEILASSFYLFSSIKRFVHIRIRDGKIISSDILH